MSDLERAQKAPHGTFWLSKIAVGLSISIVSAASSFAQTASEIVPETLAPDLQKLRGSVVFTGQAGTQAPPGAEAIGVTLSGVTLENALPEMADANAVFKSRLTRGRIPVSELFDATSDLEATYARAGYVLTRVVLPQQSLRDGGRLRVVVVDGFVEKVDTSGVPENTKPRIEALTQPLVNRKRLTRAELERQLLLAGDVPGTALKSAIGAGSVPGATVIALQPEYKKVTGFFGLANPSGSELGSVSFNLGVEVNSPLRMGETLYLRLSGSPENLFSSDPQSRVVALGAVFPIGISGANLNVEYTKSDVTPDNTTATRSDFERLSTRLIYPFIRGRQLNVTGQLALDLQEDSQEIIGGARVHHDRLSVLRAGVSLSYQHENNAFSTAGLVYSRGLDAFDARKASDAVGGTGLSRAGDAVFNKLAGSFTHKRALSEKFSLSLTGRFQTSFGDPLLTSEQFSLVGPQELSAFDSGSLRGDSGWLVRTELSTMLKSNIGQMPLTLSPYLFAGAGVARIESPLVGEKAKTEALVYGIGMDLLAQTNSDFRSGSVRIEVGRGELDGNSDENRFSISASYRF